MTAAADMATWISYHQCEAIARARRLENLAHDPSDQTADAAHYWASRHLTSQQFHELWEAYREAVSRRDGLDTGQRDWQSEYPRLIPAQCPNGSARQEAVQMAAQDAQDLLDELVHGPKWGNQ
jgi:hypothetical protein